MKLDLNPNMGTDRQKSERIAALKGEIEELRLERRGLLAAVSTTRLDPEPLRAMNSRLGAIEKRLQGLLDGLFDLEHRS